MKPIRMILKFSVIVGCLLTGSCATYQSKVFKSRELVESGQISEAVKNLKTFADQPGDDQLIYVLDYATLLQYSGDLTESNQYFFKALKLIDQFDYQSISRVTGSLLFNEEMVQYKGDTFEKIFVNAYLALNFLELNDLDSALVESRRINQKYQVYRQEEKKNFEMNSFASYLSAMIWEADKKYDDAYLAFLEAYKIDSNVGQIHEDLIRTARKAQRMDEYKKWKSQFPQVKEDPRWYDSSLADVIIIFQNGWGARKDFNPQSPRFPILKSVYSESRNARISIEPLGKNGTPYLDQTAFVYSVDDASIRTLVEDQGSLVARRLTGVVAKEVAADQIRQKNELLGLVAQIAMHASDRADLRQWSFLPREFQMARIRVKPGKYNLRLTTQNRYSETAAGGLSEKEFEIKAGKTRFFNWRRF
ncbi:MAG: hypothetical protein JNL11_14790 [Bdellovibrionaceae bacterium]|nr:hypothetical protein [Pseudobdellovibrionaceae bacterium]